MDLAGIAAFEMEYAHWVEEQNRQICELRNALQAHITDVELNILVENGYSHYYNLFRMKADAAKADVFYLISGVWRTSAERFFHWIGGFRPSELLHVISSSFISVIDGCFSLFIYFLVFGIDSLFTSSLSGSHHYGMPYLQPCSRTAYLNKLFLVRHINFFNHAALCHCFGKMVANRSPHNSSTSRNLENFTTLKLLHDSKQSKVVQKCIAFGTLWMLVVPSNNF